MRIGIEAPRGTELRSELTAVSAVVLYSKPDVLLIPLQALRENLDQPIVLAWEEGVMVENPITTGNSDGSWTVVESGLSEGDLIVMDGSAGTQESESGDSRPVGVGENGN